MDEVKLAELFVKYASLKDQLDIIGALIEAEILERKETVKIAGISVTYYKPTIEYEYEEAAKKALAEEPIDLTPYTTTKEIVRWKDVCIHLYGEDLSGNVPTKEIPARAAIR